MKMNVTKLRMQFSRGKAISEAHIKLAGTDLNGFLSVFRGNRYMSVHEFMVGKAKYVRAFNVSDTNSSNGKLERTLQNFNNEKYMKDNLKSHEAKKNKKTSIS